MVTDNFESFASSLIKQVPFDVSDLELDHCGYQTSSAQDYENLKEDSFTIGELISENIVSGKRVAIFRFTEPFEYEHYKILGFELVEPKEGQICESELDHLEFVILVSFNEFIEIHGNAQWDLYAKDRGEFAKLTLRLYNGKSAKFHTKNIFDEIPD
jgi:predicted metalloenzyme YecM